ncbi:MAG: ABC transporter permease subunit [Gammaproteobacteria bacterium]|nr:ABC transporter permease subunit [Gammaproteobacteria bacterium]
MSAPSARVEAAPAAAGVRGSLRRWRRSWPLYPSLLFLVFFFVYPATLLLGLSGVDDDGNLTLDHYLRLFASDLYVNVLIITLKVAVWTTIFSILAGYPVAYLLANVGRSTRNTLIIWVLMPFWTSFLVRTFAWIVLLGRNGALNDLLTTLGVVEYPIRIIYNFMGVMIGMVHALMPLCVLTMLAVMEGIDTNLSRAAATLGARGGQAFWRVYFPLSVPGIAAGALLIFITALGFFITPALLGGRRETMIVQVIIFQIHEVLNWGFAGAIALLLLTTVLIIFYLYDRLLGLSTLSGETTAVAKSGGRDSVLGRAGAALGRGFVALMGNACDLVARTWERVFPYHAERPRRAWGRRLLWLTVLLVLAFLALPAFFVIPVSFTEESFLSWPPKGFSLQWYERVFESPFWFAAAGRSLVVAVLSGALAMLLGVPAAFCLLRQRIVGKTAIFAFIVSPMIIPHIIIAVSLFYLYSKLALVGTTLGLVLGHTVITIPFVVITVMALLKNYDQRLDQAAWTLGATRWRTLWHVTFPIIRAGLIAAFMFAFIISFDELTIAIFVTGGDFLTLPKKMWDDAILQVSPTLAAVATMLLVFMSAVILLSEFLRRRASSPT